MTADRSTAPADDLGDDLARLGTLLCDMSAPITIADLRRPITAVDGAATVLRSHASPLTTDVGRNGELPSTAIEPLDAGTRSPARTVGFADGNGGAARHHGRTRLLAASGIAATIAVATMVVANRQQPPVATAPPRAATTDVTVTSLPAPPPSTTGGGATTSLAATTSSTVPAGVSRLARLGAYSGWLLPSFVPDGWELSSLTANAPNDPSRRPPGAPVFGPPTRWEHHAGGGDVDATATIESSRQAAQASAPTDISRPTTVPNGFVNGHEASAFDSGEGPVVSWVDAGVAITLRVNLLDRAAALALAETVERGSGDEYVLPASTGFTQLITARPPTNAVGQFSAGWSRADGSGYLSMSVSPNDDTIASLAVRTRSTANADHVVTVESVAGRDRVVVRQPADHLGPFNAVSWIENGFAIDLRGRVTDTELLAMAASIVPVDAARIDGEATAITDRLAARPTAGEVTMADGTVVTVKHGGRGPIGLCVAAGEERRCSWQVAESMLAGEPAAQVSDVFDLGGRRLLLGWSAGSADVSVGPSQAAPARAASTVTITDQRHTAAGTFVEVVVPQGEYTPALVAGGSRSFVGLAPGEPLLRA